MPSKDHERTASQPNSIHWKGQKRRAGWIAGDLLVAVAEQVLEQVDRAWADMHAGTVAVHVGTQGFQLAVDLVLADSRAVVGPPLVDEEVARRQIEARGKSSGER